ncbi:MAG: DUF29 domain-containing protein [Candidatus Competibacteraceae bacterium]|nr:DUF29 domain-containing protein [Candidatus Competibacteraceae bacterium]
MLTSLWDWSSCQSAGDARSCILAGITHVGKPEFEVTAMKSQIYEKDFLYWTEEQTALMRAGRWMELDYEHILEELEDMGKEQKIALQSLLRQILVHLLKIDLSPATALKAKWIEEIIEFRDQAQTRIDETPSLKHHAEDLFAKAWRQARRGAVKSFVAYGEDVEVPETCPYSIDQVLDSDYFPGSKEKGD